MNSRAECRGLRLHACSAWARGSCWRSKGEANVAAILKRALELGFSISEVTPRHETLEDLFVREAIET